MRRRGCIAKNRLCKEVKRYRLFVRFIRRRANHARDTQRLSKAITEVVYPPPKTLAPATALDSGPSRMKIGNRDGYGATGTIFIATPEVPTGPITELPST